MGKGRFSGPQGKIKPYFPGLDGCRGSGHSSGVNTQYLKVGIAVLGLAWGSASAQQPSKPGIPAPAGAPASVAPPEVEASAWAAVEKLGLDVTRGNYQAAIERMNPQWKERLAKQTPGGAEALQKQIEGATKRMAQEGVSIISSVPHGTLRSFEVGPGKRVEKVAGEPDVEVLIFTKWLVLVPTVTKYRLILKEDNKPVFIEKTGFQVAVSDKGKTTWTFIDGSGLTTNALRWLYLTLPVDLDLPPISERQVRDAR
jgi:hypothetical protein